MGPDVIDNAQMPSRDSARKKRSAVRRALSLASVFDAISAVAAPHMYSLVHFTPDLLVTTSTTMSPATRIEALEIEQRSNVCCSVASARQSLLTKQRCEWNEAVIESR